MNKTTFTVLDELELQDWHRHSDPRNALDLTCSITVGYAQALAAHYGVKSPKPGSFVRLCDFRGLVLHNTGIDYTLSARQV